MTMEVSGRNEDDDGGDIDIAFAERGEEDEVEYDETASVSLTHSDLFAAVEESVISCRPLVNFVYNFNDSSNNDVGGSGNNDSRQQLTARQRRDVICGIVKSSKFNKVRARRLFAGLLPLLRKVVDEESYRPDEDDEGQIIDGDHESSTLAVLYLRICAYLVDAYLDGLIKRQKKGNSSSNNNNARRVEVIDEVFEVAEMLHDTLFPLQHCCGKEGKLTQSAIFTMCESWWHGNFEDRELFVTQLIPLLLVKSLEDTAQKNDVKRLYSIRDAINLLDFECESILTLKNHLLRTVANPLFLQSVEGRKFITHLFLVDVALVTDLHKAIKVQLFEAKRSILNAYGEIYFNAWKQSADNKDDDDNEDNDEGRDIQASIEENALQDLMYFQIHAGNPKIVSSIRIVLDKFYLNKKSPDVEGMLFRCYGPLLWRSLSATNSCVRLQAASVLTDTFPLRDPHAGQEWTEACVEKSVEALLSLMSDEVPNVRVAGSNATAKILSQFWVAIPAKDIRTLLNHIIAKHASDITSSTVRATAVKTVTTLLEEDKTHAVLRSLLPSLGNLIHDKSEKVRLAVVEMLLFVKKIRGMKYYHIVDPNNLLCRLADEGCGRNNPTGPVAVALSELLSNSFFPVGKNKGMSDVINRTLRLLTDNPDAAVVFYRNAGTQLGVNSISKLIGALMRCLCMLIVEEKKMNCEDISNLSIVIAGDELDSAKVPPNTALMATIAESISILWGSIESDLKHEQNESAARVLMELFSGTVLTEVYSHFNPMTGDGLKDAKMVDCSRACVAILNCAGKMKENQIEGLRAHVIGELAKATDMPPEKRPNLCPNMALLCEWGMVEDVAQCLASSILLYFTPGNHDEVGSERTEKSKASKKRKKLRGEKKATNDVLPQIDVEMSLAILGNVLKGSYPASLSARDTIVKSETAFNAISTALQSARIAAEKIIRSHQIGESDVSIAKKIRHIGNAIECNGRLLIHKEAMRGQVPMRLSPEAKELLVWVTDNIIPSMIKSVAAEDNSLSKLDISAISGIGSPVTAMARDDPPRRKSNRRSARESDVSFLSSDETVVNTLLEQSKRASSINAVSISSAISVLSTFAEWLSICGAESFLLIHISKWYQVLDASDNIQTRELLLGLLSHVALVCLKDDGDTTLFKELLLHLKDVDPSAKEKDIILDSLSIMSSLRDERLVDQALSTIIYVTRSVVVDKTKDYDDSVFLDMVGPGMKEVLLSILKNKRSSLLFAKCLLKEPEVSSIRENLLNEIKAHSPMSAALTDIVRLLSGDNFVTDEEAEEETDEESLTLEQDAAEEALSVPTRSRS